jgi:DNA-binding GntR family transcriptional regulator
MPKLQAALPVRRLTSPSTLREAVADQLRTDIVAGTLAPGLLLRETELAFRLGVSATPVREALVELAGDGLVDIETHRLKRVTPIDLPATHDLLRVQAALWRQGYEWAFGRIEPGHFDKLEAAIGAYQAGLTSKDPLAAVRAGLDFHSVVIIASGNTELLRVTLDRRSLIARFILLRGAATISRSGLRQHRAVLDALRRDDRQDVLTQLDRLAGKLISLAAPASDRHE